MDLSVIILTRGRYDKLTRCVRSLADQQLPTGGDLDGRFEVIVSVDGEDAASEQAARRGWASQPAHALHVILGERRGISAARKRGLERASGRWCLFVNDDVYAQPDLLAQHVAAHVEAMDHPSTRSTGAIVVGDAPWEVHAHDSMFDRLVRETSIIFFYDQMSGSSAADGSGTPTDRWKDWGFRNCYTLNLSAPTASLRAIGGFAVMPVVYGYEDLELGWRLQDRLGMPVLYRPNAKGTHDHRYTPDEYLAREHTLGRAAWHLARASPGCARAIFARDVTDPAEIAYARQFVERERAGAERLRRSFLDLGRTPSDCITGPASRRLVNLVYEQHLLLKRWEWRRGLVAASEETADHAADPKACSLQAAGLTAAGVLTTR